VVGEGTAPYGGPDRSQGKVGVWAVQWQERARPGNFGVEALHGVLEVDELLG